MKTIFHFHDQVYCGAEIAISAVDTTSEKNIKIELRAEGGGGSNPRWNQVFVSQEVLARIAAAASDFLATAIPHASSACPICAKDSPHVHSAEEVVAHRNELKRSAPQAASQQAGAWTRKDFIERIVLAVAEIPDRNSPEDQPEMMLVTDRELRNIVQSVFERADEDGGLAAPGAAQTTEPYGWLFGGEFFRHDDPRLRHQIKKHGVALALFQPGAAQTTDAREGGV